ncbi:MAG TPA: hypothetical protein VFN78_11490 [Ktedonobacterales bacterium]|nr:hypothetical protein [Ktedonobacterales bacterium]
MSFQDPTGDTMTEGASIPPLVGYGADSTLDTNSGEDAIPTSTAPAGAASGMGAPEPTSSPQHLGTAEGETASGVTVEVNEIEVDELDEESWNVRRVGLIAGVVAAGLAAGAGAAWFMINRRRAQQARIAATQVAQLQQARRLFGMLPAQTKATAAPTTASATKMAVPSVTRFIALVAPARQRLAGVSDTTVDLTRRASDSTRELSASAVALAESALAAAQDALDRALTVSQTMRDQTISTSKIAQDRFGDTWERTRDTALVTWDAAAQTAKVARDAALRTLNVVSDAAKKTADTATVEGRRTAKVATAGYKRARKVATR